MLILTTWYLWTSNWFLLHHQLSSVPTSRTGFSSWLPAGMPNQVNVWRNASGRRGKWTAGCKC
jgi:hypothetical protein